MRITQILLVALLLVALVAGKPFPRMSMVEREDEVGSGATACYKASCVGTGATCGLTSGTTVAECNDNAFCSISGTTGTCTATGALGATCNTNNNGEDCQSGFCNAGVCNGYYAAGASCSNNNQCYTISGTSSITTCTAGKCVGIAAGGSCVEDGQCYPNACGVNGTCAAPGGSGAQCSSNSHCTSAYVCINGACATPIANGQSCLTGQCGVTSICTPTSSSGNYQCTLAYSVASGSSCDDSSECGSGLFCNTTGGGIGSCTAGVSASSFKSCTLGSNNGCNAGETCTCNYNNGGTSGVCVQDTDYIGNPSGSQSAYNSFSNCVSGYLRTDYASISSHCNSQFCNYINTVYINPFRSYVGKTGPTCGASINELYTAFIEAIDGVGYFHCGSGSAVQYSFVLLVVAALAAIIM